MASPVRVLIDVSLTDSQRCFGSFWENTLADLCRCLPDASVFLLHRGAPDKRVASVPAVHLEAPSFDFGNNIREDRRLAALCREMEIDVFVSTFYSTAGSEVHSIVIAGDPPGRILPRGSAFRTMAARAARLGSTRFALTTRAADRMARLSGIASADITVLHDTLERHIAGLIIDAARADIRADLRAVRESEEASLKAESERLKKISEARAQKMWDQAKRGGPPLVRIFRAVRSVNRYPEFARRAGRIFQVRKRTE